MDLSQIGLGVDIETISRFSKIPPTFLHKVFSPLEIKYCQSKSPPSPHFAVRYAAKEAVIKALYSLLVRPPSYSDISVSNSSTGTPFIDLPGYDVKISLSHTATEAIAVVVVCNKPKK